MQLRVFILIFLLFVLAAISTDLSAQCAMCKIAAEEGVKEGNFQSRTLNTGIIYLLVMPYLAFAVVGYLWFRNYKKRKKENPEF
ncbi:MAG: hypothetical protein ACHQFW_01745 [Chitinophagales bacterium]